MSANAAIGIVLFVAIAAAFAAIWHRLWHLGTPASSVAAACAAASALTLDYLATGRLNDRAPLLFVAFFFVAFVVAVGVQIATRRLREKGGVSH